MAPTQHKPPFLIGPIADLLRWFELLIFTISAPVLTVATVIAVVDLLTGGRLLATQPRLVFAFGVALAVGIDSQLPAACERVRDAWESKRFFTLILWAVIALWTGFVIYTALRVFSIEQAQHVSETDALAIIGIDPALFASQRDLLAVVLLGLSGFARVKARAVSRAEEREQLQRELELEPMRQQLEAIKAQRVVNAAATGRAAVEALRSAPAVRTDEHDAPTRPPTGGGSPSLARGYTRSSRTAPHVVTLAPLERDTSVAAEAALSMAAPRSHSAPVRTPRKSSGKSGKGSRKAATVTATQRRQDAAQKRADRLAQLEVLLAEDPTAGVRELGRRLAAAEGVRISESTVTALLRELEARQGINTSNPVTSGAFAQ